MNLWSYIKTAMLAHPCQTISENSTTVTYRQAVDFAESYAENLKGEKSCAVLCGAEINTALALLSCLAAGITAVPLSRRYGELHCNKILDTISPSCVISDNGSKLEILRFKNSRYITPNHRPALIMCTSGTTGNPKGAMLSEKNIITNLKDIAEYFDIGEKDKILISRPLYHCAVLSGEFLTALIKGTAVSFYSGKFNPKQILDLIFKDKITVFGATPTLLKLMAEFLRTSDNCPLEKIVISGECMDKSTAERISDSFPNADIYHVYGLTEASPRVSYLPPELFSQFPDCVGLPLKSVSLKLTNQTGSPDAQNQKGVLWIKGDNVMPGYYNDPEQTEKVIKDGWLRTGDIAEINSRGLLKIIGRGDDLIIRAGMNIYPQEIENALKADERVREVLAYPIAGKRQDVQIGIRIAGDFNSEAEVKKLCGESLPPFQMPSKIELTDNIPKNASGKIIRGEYNV